MQESSNSQADLALGIKQSSRQAGRQTNYRNKLVSKAGWAVGIKQFFRQADRHTGRQAGRLGHSDRLGCRNQAVSQTR